MNSDRELELSASDLTIDIKSEKRILTNSSLKQISCIQTVNINKVSIDFPEDLALDAGVDQRSYNLVN
jgi:hypothetical protein